MFKKLLVTLLFCLALMPQILFCQPFSSFLEEVNKVNIAERNNLCRNYLSAQKAIPVTESDTVVHFLYFGKATSVALAGDATGWAPSLKMKQVDGCDLWYCTAFYNPAARLEYKIVVDGEKWQLDSLNRDVIEGGMGKNSQLIMPRYQRPTYSEMRKDIIPGPVFYTILQSEYLHEPRHVRIYLPSSYKSGNFHYPVIFFQDGFDFLKFTAVMNILDNMIADKQIQPIIAVFEQAVHRDAEYSGKLQGKFTEYVVKELIPFIDTQYRTVPSPENRALAGISNGGNIALWIGVTHPEIFTKVIAMSSNVENNVVKEFKKVSSPKLKVYLNLGKYDMPQLIPRVQNLKGILEMNHYNFKYDEYPEGHSWGFWQKYLPEALQFVYPFNPGNSEK